MMTERTFTAVFQRDGKWWVAWAEELPGANTQGATLEEARENLKEAIALILESNREDAEREAGAASLIREPLTVQI
jgi:predicted RNase H-like HicB family nuclease